MNGSYYQNPTFPGTNPPEENIEDNSLNEFRYDVNAIYEQLNNNKGKKVKVYTSFSNATDWKNKIFEGVIEVSEKDFLIISNPKNGEWNIIPWIYIDYLNFEEKVKLNN